MMIKAYRALKTFTVMYIFVPQQKTWATFLQRDYAIWSKLSWNADMHFISVIFISIFCMWKSHYVEFLQLWAWSQICHLTYQGFFFLKGRVCDKLQLKVVHELQRSIICIYWMLISEKGEEKISHAVTVTTLHYTTYFSVSNTRLSLFSLYFLLSYCYLLFCHVSQFVFPFILRPFLE